MKINLNVCMYSYVVKISYFSHDDIVQIIDVKNLYLVSYVFVCHLCSLFLYVSKHVYVQLQYETCNVKMCSNTSVSIWPWFTKRANIFRQGCGSADLAI